MISMTHDPLAFFLASARGGQACPSGPIVPNAIDMPDPIDRLTVKYRHDWKWPQRFSRRQGEAKVYRTMMNLSPETHRQAVVLTALPCLPCRCFRIDFAT